MIQNRTSFLDFESSSDEEEKQAKVDDFIIQSIEQIIKFRSINRSHNFIFIKNKNTIQVLEPSTLTHIYSFHHNNIIVDFQITKDNSLILCSSTELEIYRLSTPNLADSQIKIIFDLVKSVEVENLQKITVSSLSDVIVAINKHRIIKIFDIELNLLKSININLNLLPKEIDLFPLNLFSLTYDTKTIVLCKYNHKNLSFVYKLSNTSSDYYNNDDMLPGEKAKEYEEKIISFNENIIFVKEYQKNFLMYLNYQDSSIMFVLTDSLNFLILQKVYEFNEKTYNSIPNLRTLLYINLSNQTEIKIDKYISFSLLYDNENPIFKTSSSVFKGLRSGIIDLDPWNIQRNKNTLSENESGTFLNYNEKNFKNISSDYILFNFQDNVVLYQMNGLQAPPFNNPTVDNGTFLMKDDNNYFEENLCLLKASKTLDNQYSVFFIDKYYNIRKYFLINKMPALTNHESTNNDIKQISLKDSKYAFTMYKNIIDAKYNNENKKTFIHQIIGNESVLVLILYQLSLFKVIIFDNMKIKNVNWIKNSNYIIFSFKQRPQGLGYINNSSNNQVNENIDLNDDEESDSESSNAITLIGIIDIYSKYLDKYFNRISEKILKEKFILIEPELIFNQNIRYIYNILLEYEPIEKENEKKNISHHKFSDVGEIENKIEKSSSFNSVQTKLLLKTDTNLLYCQLLVTKNPNPKKDKEEKTKDKDKEKKKKKSKYSAKLNLLYSLNKSDISQDNNNTKNNNKENSISKEEWITMQLIFNSADEIFYNTYDEKLGIICILKITNKGKNIKKIYESATMGKLFCVKFFFNNYIVYLGESYINTYDIANRTFYRLRNDYFLKEKDKSLQELHLSLCGIYLRLSILSPSGINIIRIPRNKNQNEIYSFQFKYKFQLGKFYMINYVNNMLILNETQIELLDNISELKQTLLKSSTPEQLTLLDSNAGSLFDHETFLDYFLSDNENIIKKILNMFCYEYKVLKLSFDQQKYQNSKLIPNFVVSIDFIKQLIFDEDFHSKISSEDKKNIFNHLTFNKEEDEKQEIKPLKKMCGKDSNISHMEYIYELLSDENKRNYDNFTKYFMLKIFSKKKDYEKKTYKLSTADLCWISLITNQTDLLNFICHGKTENINWETMTMFNIPLWIKSESKLKELLVEVAKNHYKQQYLNEAKNTENKITIRNYTENIALYLYLAGQTKMLIDYYDKEPHNEKIKKFIMRDFKIKKNRNAAHENADALMNKKKYIYAAFFYLLADDVRSALDMVYEKLKDVNLTICMLKLVESKYDNNNWKNYYSLDKIYKNLFINFGTVFRDPYLVTFGYLGQGKYDLALEYLLNYDNEYAFDNNKEIFQDFDDYISNLNILSQLFAFNVFDYRLILFAKSLEKIYKIKYDETNQQIQTVANTGFDQDDWDMDALNGGDEEEEDETAGGGPSSQNNNIDPNSQTSEEKDNNKNKEEFKLKKIDINYDKLINLCLINSMKQGKLYTPIINLFKQSSKNGFKDLPSSIKDILKSLICDRIVLDTIYCPPNVDIDTMFVEMENFYDYLEAENILKKTDLYRQINYDYLLLHEFQNTYLYSNKCNLIIETLISIYDYAELIISKNSYVLVQFNFYQNVNLVKVDNNLNKLLSLFYFIRKMEEDTVEPKSEEAAINEVEKNLYVFRIIFMIYFYLLFISKVVLKYYQVTKIYETLKKLVEDYKDLWNFNKQKVILYLDDILKIISKTKVRIKNENNKAGSFYIDDGLSIYILFLNYSIIKEIFQFLKDNNSLAKMAYDDHILIAQNNFYINSHKDENNNNNNNRKISLDNSRNNSSYESSRYFNEDFNYINSVFSNLKTYTNNFDMNIEKYIANCMSTNVRYSVHDELKNVYILKNPTKYVPREKNNKIIKYEYIFRSKSEKNFYDKLKKFEILFRLRPTILKYITFLSKKFKYEKITEEDYLTEENMQDFSEKPSNYTNSSIQIMSNLFRKGYEVSNLSDSLAISDFCINNCDVTQIGVSIKTPPSIMKINILNNLVARKRSESLSTLEEKEEPEKWEQTYTNSFSYSYMTLVEQQLIDHYSEMLSMIYHDILLPKSTYIQFPTRLSLPPATFNSIPVSNYLKNISMVGNQTCANNIGGPLGNQNVLSSSNDVHSKILLSHPQLPLFLSSNSNRGILSVYSFDPNNNVTNSIDEFFVDKNYDINNSNNNKNNIEITKMKFNSYGDNLLAIDKEGSLYTWTFEHVATKKTPKYQFNKSETFCCDDGCFLNNTGVLATTCNKKEERPKSYLFDLLLPQKKRKIAELFQGGDFILPIASDASFMIVNDRPGNISFVDIRKMEVVKSFQAHPPWSEIKDIQISEDENFLITCGRDLNIKIWDLTTKTEPLLIESIQPFEDVEKKMSNMKLHISNGFLFASKDNCIKLLRNNII